MALEEEQSPNSITSSAVAVSSGPLTGLNAAYTIAAALPRLLSWARNLSISSAASLMARFTPPMDEIDLIQIASKVAHIVCCVTHLTPS